ncbi:heterokaryon incompatibility protein-domain-containing protein [Lasiosphaeris hirsuta]|uniref:Heterokaryon incompatibility protein-domain-containing protein n=1 Tax=Lasiosphaeris hirsuta TaxID=260670 RepID=A0AA40A235_9PEZI|nr:heterokaryon incompatibility protein-domain-containing protein [Lasiosphaeris hirsuta]
MEPTWTYRHLIKPLPVKHNFASAATAPALKTCVACRLAVPDRARAHRDIIATSYEFIDTYPEFPLLKASAEAGCGLCWMIRSEIRKNWAVRPMEEWGFGPLSEDDPSLVDLLETPWDGRVRVFNLKFTFDRLVGALEESPADPAQMGGMVTGVGLEFGPVTPEAGDEGSSLHNEISQIIRFKAFDSVDLDSNQETSRRRLPSREALSDENIDMMHSWLINCRSSHESCRLPPSAWLPTRLLDVGTYAESRLPRVVETKNLSANNAPYAALSHMWGDVVEAPPLQAMKFNYDSLMQEIPLRRLPQNFADAALTCQRLGIRYIWIDSLCIIQDSKEDWEREAQMMHKIYRNAELTIVATSATSSHDGFLARDLSVVPAVKIQYGTADEPRSLIVTPVDDDQNGLRHGDVDGSEWNTRGWTMQERALSTRSIHFCRNKMYFECRGRLASEENEPEQTQASDPFLLWPRALDTTSQDSKEWYNLWRRALIGYSRRRLTMASDKLTAIQSIASEMQSRLPDPRDYLSASGVWYGDIANQLLWYVESGIPRRVPGRAPSWSWASLDAAIGFRRGSRGPPKSGSSGELCRVQGSYRPVAVVKRVDELNWKRAGFPYDILGFDGQIFAHGVLDLDNRDDVLRSGSPFFYLHVSNEQHPSGLLLAIKATTSLASTLCAFNAAELVSRVGVATIFHTSGETINPAVFQATESFAHGPGRKSFSIE